MKRMLLMWGWNAQWTYKILRLDFLKLAGTSSICNRNEHKIRFLKMIHVVIITVLSINTAWQNLQFHSVVNIVFSVFQEGDFSFKKVSFVRLSGNRRWDRDLFSGWLGSACRVSSLEEGGLIRRRMWTMGQLQQRPVKGDSEGVVLPWSKGLVSASAGMEFRDIAFGEASQLTQW